MAIDFKTFIDVAPHVLRVRKPLMLRGRHGVGKSELVYQIASTLDLPVVERRASQMTEGDLVGLPRTDGEVTSFCAPDWLDDACKRAVLLFLDEVDRAIPEVRQGIFELTDSRKIFGNYLHPDTVVVAAVNGGEHGSQYQVGEMDPAELDRWTVFDVEPSVEDWLDWAKENTTDVVWDFVNHNRSHLEHSGDFEPNKVYPSRRSWKRFSDCLKSAEMVEEYNPAVFHLATGFVGFEASVAFNDFFKNYERQVTPDMVVNDGQVEKTSDFTINEHCALIDKMDASEMFNAEMTEKQAANLANYFVSLPSEAVMKLWQVLGKGDINNVTKFHKTIASNGETVSGKLVNILTGN